MSETVHIYYHPQFLSHKGFPFFAEKPARLETLLPLFKALALPVIPPSRATPEQMLRAHTAEYVAHVEMISRKNPVSAAFANITSPYVQWYTRVSPGTYDAAVLAAGSVCAAVEDTLSGKCKRAFCATRPPGHHAGPETGEGFCLFNNAAIGALHALHAGAARVAIIDFDRHHGNGTQDIVETRGDGNILLISSYQDGCKYNHNGAEGRLSECTLTIPIPEHSAYEAVEKRFREQALPALHDFKPDLIVLSAGFDMHKADPLTNIRLESRDYESLTDLFVQAANDLCQGRIVSVLEGGYDVMRLKECVGHHLSSLKK